MKLTRTTFALLSTLALAACAGEGDLSIDDTTDELRDRGPQKIQDGAEVLLLAVTDDDYAVYQDGQKLYASALRKGAKKRFIADVPGDAIAYPLQVGDVVFLWLTPQRQFPGFGVSPLVLWDSKNGARRISELSSVGTVATAASADSEAIVFTTNVDELGLRGDIAYARTDHALSPRILLRDIPLDFPTGYCRPLVGFAGPEHDQYPIAAYCPGTDTTATLSTWRHGQKQDVISGIANPMPFTLENDLRNRPTFFLNLADNRVVKVSLSGEVTTVDNVKSTRGFLTADGTAVYNARPTPTSPLELRWAAPGQAPRTIGNIATIFTNRHNRGGYFRPRTPAPDTSKVLFATKQGPPFGFFDMNFLDVATGEVTPLDSGLTANVGSEAFTSNSRYAMYIVYDPDTGMGKLYGATKDGPFLATPSTSVDDVLRGQGSDVSYNDNPVYSNDRQGQVSTSDLSVTDLDHPERGPRLVATQAYYFWLATADRKTLVFGSPSEAAGPGLYIADGRR
jgi:hypothetical protein